VLATIRKPMLITHGAADSIVRQSVIGQTTALVPHAEPHVMPGAGHAPFWDGSVEFNRRLRTFADGVARADQTIERPMSLR